MRFIVSTYYEVFIADDSGRVIEELFKSPGHIGHYGITWSEDYMYLTCADATDPVHHQWVVVLDKDLRVYTKILYRELHGTHDIIWHDGWLWCCSTTKDQVVQRHMTTGERRVWEPEEGAGGHGHLNSIWFGPGYVLLGFHYFGKGPIICKYSYPKLRLQQKWDMGWGVGLHNVYMHEGKLLTLRDHSVWWGMEAYPVASKLLRGLAITDNRILVGGSELVKDRSVRLREKAGYVFELDPDTLETRREFEFLHCPVASIRILDEPDHAHHGMPWTGRYGI